MSGWLDKVCDPKTGKYRFRYRLNLFLAANTVYVFFGICFLVFAFLLFFVSSWLGLEITGSMFLSAAGVLLFGFIGASIIKGHQNRLISKLVSSPASITRKPKKEKSVPTLDDLSDEEINKKMERRRNNKEGELDE